jgi:catechol 2,3-dioxygenase-like lactoylglutathione lyase family enzyme
MRDHATGWPGSFPAILLARARSRKVYSAQIDRTNDGNPTTARPRNSALSTRLPTEEEARHDDCASACDRHQEPICRYEGSHVALRVPDFEASKTWFVEKLDFRVIHEWPVGELQLAYLAPPNDDHFWVEIMGGGKLAPQADHADLNASLRDPGYHHLCVDVKSVDTTLAELRRRGVVIVRDAFDLPAVGRRLAFLADPWGNLIELAEILD